MMRIEIQHKTLDPEGSQVVEVADLDEAREYLQHDYGWWLDTVIEVLRLAGTGTWTSQKAWRIRLI